MRVLMMPESRGTREMRQDARGWSSEDIDAAYERGYSRGYAHGTGATTARMAYGAMARNGDRYMEEMRSAWSNEANNRTIGNDAGSSMYRNEARYEAHGDSPARSNAGTMGFVQGTMDMGRQVEDSRQFGKYSKLVGDALRVIQSPPSTWNQYMKDKDFASIAKMEGDELVKAIKDGKSLREIKQELSHTIAALMRMGVEG